jgi:rhomboid protease GluP
MAKCSSCGRAIGFSLGKKLCPWCVEHQRAQQGDGKEYQRVMPTPWTQGRASSGPTFTHLFVAVNVLVYIAMIATGIPFSGPNPLEMIGWGANFGLLTVHGQAWRLITYMFLHYGIIHMGFNMWCLWDLGALAESLYGDWFYAVTYILSGIGGGLLTIAWHQGSPTAGASGAVFGVAGALIASFGFNVVLGFISTGTDNACHIGGLLTGLLIGGLIAVIAPDRDQIGRRMAILALVIAMLFAAWLLLPR